MLDDAALLSRAQETYGAALTLECSRSRSGSLTRALDTWFRAFCERERLPPEFARWMQESGRRGKFDMTNDYPLFRTTLGGEVRVDSPPPVAVVRFGPFTSPDAVLNQVKQLRAGAGWPSVRELGDVAPSTFDVRFRQHHRFRILLEWLALERRFSDEPDQQALLLDRRVLQRRAGWAGVRLRPGALTRTYDDRPSQSELARRFRAMHASHRRIPLATIRTELFRSQPFRRLLAEFCDRI